MKIEKNPGVAICGWTGAVEKRPAGESKGQQAAIVNILLGRAAALFFPQKFSSSLRAKLTIRKH